MTPDAMAKTHAAAFTWPRPWTAEAFAAFQGDPHCLIAGDPAAFAVVRVILDEAELLTIATHPDHRRQGLARKVMAAWLAEARARGATRAFLEVAADNIAALALYKAKGFTPCGIRRGYYKRTDTPATTAGPAAAVDAIVMARTLS